MSIANLHRQLIADRNVCLRIGIDMGGNDIKFGATDLTAERVLTDELIKRPSLTQEGPAKTVGQMIDGIGALLDQLGATWDDVADIAVTVPCPCSPVGHIIEATNLGTKETKALWAVPFGEHLAAAVETEAGFPIPVFCCNDANAAGQDDDFVRFGMDTSPRTSVFITTGTGLGGCVMTDGSVHYGVGQAGEIGHVKVAIPSRYEHRFVDDADPLCGCGGRRCVETYASLTGLLRRVTWALTDEGVAHITQDLAKSGQTVNPDVVAALREHAKEGPKKAAYHVRTFADRDADAFARWLLEDWGIMIGALFASVSPLLHPNLYIIGGGMTELSEAGRDWFISVVRRVYGEVNGQKCFDSRPGECEIVWSVTMDQGWRGAILMAMRARQAGA